MSYCLLVNCFQFFFPTDKRRNKLKGVSLIKYYKLTAPPPNIKYPLKKMEVTKRHQTKIYIFELTRKSLL